MALFIKLLLTPCKQKLVDHALLNQRLNFLNKCVFNEEWIIDQFSLKRRQKKRNGWGYGILREFVAKWLVLKERCAIKNQVTLVLDSTLYSWYWRNLYIWFNFLKSVFCHFEVFRTLSGFWKNLWIILTDSNTVY